MLGGGMLGDVTDGAEHSVPCILVTGMHRTGTSLVAGLLHRHGLWLGEEADMMAANPYNPDGYFENNRLVEINDAILGLYGGSWSSPPDFPRGWTEDAQLCESAAVAREIGARLDANRPWGFKDPRAALTLPFWRSVWGEPTVIVTLRNPLETARSLNRRDGMPIRQGMDLWAVHYLSLLEQTAPETRIVVGFEEFHADPPGSAAALLSRLPGLTEHDPEIARHAVRQPLRHHQATLSDLQAQGASSELIELYEQLRGEVIHHAPQPGANPSYEQQATASLNLTQALSSLDLAIRDVHVDVQRLASVVARLEVELGFVRTSDLAGIAALLDHQRSSDLPRLASGLDHISQSLPTLSARVEALEARDDISVNGREP